MKPLVLIGGLAPDDRDRVREFALRLNAPVYAEPLSGLREDADLAALHLRNERILGRAGFTRVIRIGNVPTLRFWRDLDEKLSGVPVVSYSALPFRGLSRGDVHALEELPRSVSPVDRDEDLFARDRDLAERLDRILDVEPESELALVRALSRDLPHGARIYLGNSLPIREWDLVATREERGLRHRGEPRRERDRRTALDVLRVVLAVGAERCDRRRSHRALRPQRAVDRAAARSGESSFRSTSSTTAAGGSSRACLRCGRCPMTRASG